MSKRLTVFVAVFAALLSVTLSVQADPVPLDYYWVGGEAGPDSNPNQNTKYLYFTTKNWRVGSQDGNQATVNMGSSGYAITCYILNDAINESQTSNPVFFDYGSLGPAVVTLNIGQEGNTNAATVQRTGGNLAIDSGKTINISDGGTLEYTPSNSGHKLTINSGGYLNLNDNGTLKAKSTTAIEIASGGTLTMSGGTLATNSMTINGTFTHTGGTLTPYDNTGMTLTGDYTLGSGATLKPNGTINVTGTAVLNGIIDLSRFVANPAQQVTVVTTTNGVSGSYNVNGSGWTSSSDGNNITATFTGDTNAAYWNNGNPGTINYDAGSNWIEYKDGQWKSVTTTWIFGNTNTQSDRICYILPYFDAETSTVKNVDINFNNTYTQVQSLTIGNGIGGSTGNVTVTRNGQFDVTKLVTINKGGKFTDNGQFSVSSGGALNVNGGEFIVNAGSNQVTNNGTITISNEGTLTITSTHSFRIGDRGKGEININGGSLIVNTPTYLGVGNSNEAQSSGTINQTSGDVTFTNVLYFGWGDWSGNYNLSGGTLTTTNTAGLWSGNGTGVSTFNVVGGVANFNKSGESFTVGVGGTNSLANVFNLNSGTVNATDTFAIQYGGTLNVAKDGETGGDGVLNANKIDINNGGNLNMSSGTINLGAGGITNSTGASPKDYTITLSGGTFGTNNASWATSLDATISSNAVTFAPDAGKSITWRGVMSGAGALTKTEAGTLELFGANSFEGGTTISNGQISLHANGSLGTGAIAIDTNGSLTFTGDMTPQPKTIANAVSGTGTIVKQGASNFTVNLDGNLTDFSGNMIISGGTLSVLMNGTNRSLNVTNLSGPGNLELRLASGNGNTSLPNLTNNGFTGVISLVESGGANGNKLDTGYKSFDGFTFNINSGTTIYVDEEAFGANVNLSGTGNNEGHGALRLHKNMTGNITVMENNSVLGIDRTAVTVSGNITSGADSGETTLVIKNVVDNNGSGTFTGVISDGTSGSQLGIQLAGGTHTFTGANTYSGGTTISAGTLAVNNANGLGTGLITLNGGTLDTTGSVKTFANDISVGSNGGTITAQGGNNYTTFNSISGSGALTTNGTVQFNGSGGYNGHITVASGYVCVVPGAVGTVDLTFTSASANGSNFKLASEGTLSIGALNSSYDSDLFTSVSDKMTFEIGAGNKSSSFAGKIRGIVNKNNLTVKKIGSGTLTLNRTGYVYGGDPDSINAVQINGGKMIVDASHSVFKWDATIGFWGTAPITVNSGTELEFVKAYTVTPNADMTVNSATLTLDADQYVNKLTLNSGTVTGNGGLHVGLTGNGVWSVQGGVSTINNNMSIVKNGDITTFTISFDKGSTLNITNVFKGDASANFRGSNIVFQGTGDGPGNIYITTTTAMTDLGNFTFNNMNGTIAAPITGTDCTVTKTGAGTVTLSGANTYTGLTTVSGGVLELTGDAIVANGPVSIGANGTLVYNVDGQEKSLSITETNANAIFGTGKIIKTGDGTLKIYSDAENMIDVESLTVSSGRVDIKEYFNGKLIVDSEGTFSPGNSVGMLTIDNFTVGETTYGGGFILNEAGAELLMEIGGATPDLNDGLIVNGDITFKDGSIITLVNNSNLGLGESFTAILSASNSDTLKVLDHIQTTDFTDLKYETVDYGGKTVYAITGRTFNANEIPEPSTWALLILGAAGMLYWRKRKNA